MKRFLTFTAVFLASLSVQVWARTDIRLLAMSAFFIAICSWLALLHHMARYDIKKHWIGTVLAASIIVVVLAPPATSKDFNSYALYGRMISEYGASPYTHEPVDFAGDPWFARTSSFWTDSPSVYGPAFTGISTAITSVTGTSVLFTRLAFQTLAALSLLGCVALAARRLGAARAMALIGLNPLLLTMGVNDAHCDLLIGLGILAAALALERNRFLIAGVAIGLAVSVKIACLPALGGALIWAMWRPSPSRAVTHARRGLLHAKGFGGQRLRNVVALLGGALGTIGGLLALVEDTEMLAPLRSAAGRHTRFSIWNPVHDLITNNSAVGLPTHTDADAIVSLLANLAVLSVGLFFIFRCRNHARPVIAVAVGLVVYQVLGAYVLAWYAVWSLPALALVASSRVYSVALAHGCWVAIAYFSGYGGIAVALALALFYFSQSRISANFGPGFQMGRQPFQKVKVWRCRDGIR